MQRSYWTKGHVFSLIVLGKHGSFDHLRSLCLIGTCLIAIVNYSADLFGFARNDRNLRLILMFSLNEFTDRFTVIETAVKTSIFVGGSPALASSSLTFAGRMFRDVFERVHDDFVPLRTEYFFDEEVVGDSIVVLFGYVGEHLESFVLIFLLAVARVTRVVPLILTVVA